MPVSVNIRAESSPHAYDGVTLRLRIEGQDAAILTTLRALVEEGAVGFFEVPSGTLLRTKAKRVKRISRKQESTVERVGGCVQPGSGSRQGCKGDGRIRGRYRIENKFTRTNSYRVELSDLAKIRSECTGLEVPVFEVQFREKHTMAILDKWVMIPRKEWEKHVHTHDAE